MADLSKLSDKELLAMAGGQSSPPTVKDMSHLSDKELLAMAGGSQPQQPKRTLISDTFNKIMGADPEQPNPTSMNEALSLDPGAINKAQDLAMGGIGRDIGPAIMKPINAKVTQILDSPTASKIIAKVEGIFGKENPIKNHIVDSLEAYKSQFQFPENSSIEKGLNSLIDRVKSTEISKLSPSDVNGITKRLGIESIDQAVKSGSQALGDMAGSIASDAHNAFSGVFDTVGKAAQFGVPKATGALGSWAGHSTVGHAGTVPGYFVGDKLGQMLVSAVKNAPDLAVKLGLDTSLSSEAISRLIATPEARDLVLHHMLEKDSQDIQQPQAPQQPAMVAGPVMSNNIKSRFGSK